MRTLKYEVYQIHDIEDVKEGTIVDLLFDIPYLLGFSRSFPTFQGLNNVLRGGIKDAGMSGGCEWEPFEISKDEYGEVVESVKHDSRLKERPFPEM